MEKVIRDGFVAVLYSPGYGAGWSTECDGSPEVLFDPKIVDMVEKKASAKDIVAYCRKAYPDMYTGGARDLTIAWLPVGTKFRITEYDGSESIELEDEIVWQTA